MIKRPATDNSLSDPTRRACLKGVAGFALAALGGLDQVAQAATNPGAETVPEDAADQARTDVAGVMLAYVGCRTTKERNARGEGINVYRVDPATGTWTHVQLLKD